MNKDVYSSIGILFIIDIFVIGDIMKFAFSYDLSKQRRFFDN